MKLSELTIEILKNFATLNQGMQFRAGNELTTITIGKSILAKARVVESFPFDFAIFDLNKLLAKLSLYKDCELEFEPDRVLFKSSDGRRNDYIKFSSPKVIAAPDLTKKIALDDPEHEFDLSAEDLLWQRKSAGISNSPYMIFHGDGKKVYIRCTDVKDDSSDLSSTEIGKTKSKFDYVIKTEYWKLLDGGYRVKLKKGLAKFEHSEKPIEYYIAIEDNLSTY
jgi:hypothetical protein